MGSFCSGGFGFYQLQKYNPRNAIHLVKVNNNEELCLPKYLVNKTRPKNTVEKI